MLKGLYLLLYLILLFNTISGAPDESGILNVNFELNGQTRVTRIKDMNIVASIKQRPVALVDVKGSVGAPMPGVVVDTKVKKGGKCRI